MRNPFRQPHTLVLDLETKRSAAETPGGWSNPAGMGVSVVGTYHYRGRRLVAYRERDFNRLASELRAADLVVGFNVVGFDLPALAGALGDWVRELPTCDLLQAVERSLGHRLKLDDLAQATLGSDNRRPLHRA